MHCISTWKQQQQQRKCVFGVVVESEEGVRAQTQTPSEFVPRR